jgi:hypothetical protein
MHTEGMLRALDVTTVVNLEKIYARLEWRREGVFAHLIFWPRSSLPPTTVRPRHQVTASLLTGALGDASRCLKSQRTRLGRRSYVGSHLQLLGQGPRHIDIFRVALGANKMSNSRDPFLANPYQKFLQTLLPRATQILLPRLRPESLRARFARSSWPQERLVIVIMLKWV